MNPDFIYRIFFYRVVEMRCIALMRKVRRQTALEDASALARQFKNQTSPPIRLMRQRDKDTGMRYGARVSAELRGLSGACRHTARVSSAPGDAW